MAHAEVVVPAAAGALQDAIFNSARFSSIATDEKGVIQIFNVGAERMLGYTAAEVMNKITPADISDPAEVIARAAALSLELGTTIAPGFEALVFKASRGIEDIYELTYIRKDGSRFPALVSVTALRDAGNDIIGYLLIGTDNSARKQAQEHRDRFFQLSQEMLCTIGFDGYFKDLNPAWEKALGYTRAEFFAQPFIDLVHPDDRAMTIAVDARNVSDGTDLHDFVNRYRGKDGSYRYLQWSVNPVIGEELIFGSARDITEHRLADEAQREAAALQNAIFESANFSSIATDARGVIQIFNVGAERMLGYAAADVLNKITPADISDPNELIARAAELSAELDTPITPGFEALVFKASRGIEDIYELTYIRKDGSRFPAIVSVTALRDAGEGIIGYLLIGTDNTARKQAEEALLKAGALQRAIFESANFSSIATDAKGVIQIFNVGAERMLGYTAAEVMNKITPADISDPQEVIARAAALSVELDTPITPGFEALVFKASRGIEDIYELTYIRKDGSRFPALVSVTALRDADHDIIGYLLIGTDNTARQQVEEDRKRFERALEEKNVELEHASRMKSEFLATMSHELRTPLNAIIGFSEALKDGLIGRLEETQQEYIGDIFSSGQHLLSLINDILDLSKVEAGMMALELQAVDLEGLLSNSLSIVREKALGQRIQVELDAAGNLGMPLLDMRKTKQIVYNLLSNAVKFSSSGGRVTMYARRVPRSAVGTFTGDWAVHGFELAPSEYGEFIEIRVSDGGIGIAQANLAKLFQPFSQIDSGLARRFEGTGLGLAMVKQMAELHGGSVAVASAVGKGAQFAVWLPLRESVAGGSGSYPVFAASPDEDATRPGRVALVVEQDDRAADLARLLLETEGFTVLRAASAEIALEMAQRQTLSLITLDVQLKGLDGWELLHRLARIESLAHVPVVIISSLVEGNLALSRGAAAVLQKPVSHLQLRASLDGLGLHPSAQRTYTVLVVDDDPKAVEVIAAFLPAPAYAVVRAYGGAEAISLAQRLRPDLILLDLMMPEVNGFDVADAMLANPETASIPILVVTAKQITRSDRTVLGSTPHVVGIVEKAGFNRASFIDEVRRALPQN